MFEQPSRHAGAAPTRDPSETATGTAPLRICYISETLHAGVGRHLMEIIGQLAARGHEIHLVYSPGRVEERFRSTIMQQPNVHCVEVPMRRAIGYHDVSAFRRIRKYVAANGPFDIVHGHSSKGGGYARLLKLFSQAPTVYTPHAFVTLSPALSRSKLLAYGALEIGLALLTDRLICVSEAEEAHARELGIAAKRLADIPLGADPLGLPPREIVRAELGLAPSDVVVGFLGRMDEQKAPEALVAAMRHVLPEMPQVKLVMVGDGPKYGNLEAALRDLGAGNRARCFAFAEGVRYVSAFDMIVVPSLYEGFAYVLLEALHAGLPIVSTPVGGTDEAIAENENGFIVPHDSDTRMAEAIRRLAADDNRRRAMGKISKERAARFTIARMVDSLEQLYRDVLAERAVKQRRPRSARYDAPADGARASPAGASSRSG